MKDQVAQNAALNSLLKIEKEKKKKKKITIQKRKPTIIETKPYNTKNKTNHIKKRKEEHTMKILEGKVVAQGTKIGIVASRFNEFIVSKLIGGAQDALIRHGVADNDITLAWVPGAFEIPLTAQKMAETGHYDAVICLGAVIRGATSHYDYVCAEVSKGIAAVGLKTEIPVIFGIVTTDNIEQAIERAGTKAGNKGYDAACTAIEMVNLIQEMQ